MITDLTKDSVSILTETNGVKHRTAYCNTPIGRDTLKAEQKSDVVAGIMAVWGDTPTIPDEEPEPESSPLPTIEDRLAALEAVQLEMILGGAL